MRGKVKTNLSGTTVERFMQKTAVYLEALEKPVFAQISPSVNDVRFKLDEMENLQNQVKEGSHKAVILRNAIRKEINADISRMCEWVNMMANGNNELLNQSAFEQCKVRSTAPIPTGIKKMVIYRSEVSGKALVTWKGNGSKFYRAQMTMNPNENNEWKDIATVTSNRCELTGLPVGKFCYFRVQGVNSSGAGEFSEVYMYMAS